VTGRVRTGCRLALAILSTIIFLASPLSAEGGLLNVLFISSHEAGTVETAEVISAFRSETAAAGHRSEVFLEALDSLRLPPPADGGADIENDLAERYRGIRFDLILAQASQAVEMAVRYRDRHAPGVPVYCFDTIDEDLITRYSAESSVFGRPLGSPLSPTLRLAAELFPKARKAIFLASVTDPDYVPGYLDALIALSDGYPGLELVPIINANFATVEKTLADAGQDAFVLLLPGGWVLPNGDFLSETEMVDRLEAEYPLPYFGIYGSTFGTGLVGGCLVDRAAMGREAGDMALSILFAKRKPVAWLYSNAVVPTLDWRALKRFDVPSSLIPEDAVVKFEPPGFWLQYQRQLMATGAVLLGLLFILLVEASFRKRKNLILAESNEKLEATVLARTEELRTANAELEASNANLEDSLRRIEAMQERLVSDVQDSVLGRIALGLAHEVNNPLGAIQASTSSMKAALVDPVGGMTSILCGFDEGQFELFRRGLAVMSGKEALVDPEETMSRGKNLAGRMDALGLSARRSLADLLADSGLAELSDEDLRSITAEENARVLAGLYRAQSIERGVAIALQATGRIASIVEALRSYARDSVAGPSASVSHIGESLSSAVGFFREAEFKDVDIACEVEEGLPEVPVAFASLVRVWTNLLRNSIQAMGGKGKIAVKAAREDPSVLVEVIDWGPGVDPALRERLFTPFAGKTSLESGLGLGLSICKRIVEGSGGSISHEEREGRTVFAVRLPAVSRPAGDCPEEAAHA